MPYSDIRVNDIYTVPGAEGYNGPEKRLIEVVFDDPDKHAPEQLIGRYKVTTVTQLGRGMIAVSAVSGGDAETPPEEVVMEFNVNPLGNWINGTLYSPEASGE